MKSSARIRYIRGLLVVAVSAFAMVQVLAAADKPGTGNGTAAADGHPSKDAATTVAGRGALRGVTLAPGGFSLAAASVVVHSTNGSPDQHVISDELGVFQLVVENGRSLQVRNH